MRRRISIGLPSPGDSREKRFPLTPEAVAMLTERGYELRVESGATAGIHYSDTDYMRQGARITPREDALQADLVVMLCSPKVRDIQSMRRGAMLLTLLDSVASEKATVEQLLHRNIITLAIDLLCDSDGNAPFADILCEIDGRAAMALASSMLASPNHGKGILLGGVAGVIPCEVLILGAGIAGRAAAASALGLGASVRMLDNDVYRLRRASALAGCATSVIHPRVLDNALRTADVIIGTPMRQAITIAADQVNLMKRGVIIMDLCTNAGKLFPTLPAIDITTPENVRIVPPGTRICYTGVGNAVPRTAAMALSNTFLSLLHDIMDCDGAINTVSMLPGVQRAVATFLGKPVNRRVASTAGLRPIDIALLLNCS
jgi:alanine dehydrogenase